MKKNYFRFVIIIATISLVGVIFTQLYWVKKAISFKEEQFNNSTLIAMKGVVNQLLNVHNDSTMKRMKLSGGECYMDWSCITEIVDAKLLESLLKKEMRCFRLSKDYEYGVYSKSNNEFKMGVFDNFKDELICSPHQVALDCLYKPGNYFLSVYIPHQKSKILLNMAGWLSLSGLFIVVVVMSFYYTISTLMRQKKLAEMKTDFVNNMTHEFKTPISTISLASEMLLRPNVYESSDKTKKYAHIIFDENARLQNQVEQVLQISVLDKGDMKIKARDVDIHKLLSKLRDNFNLSLKESKGKLTLNLNAGNSNIFADRAHVMNMISNLLDNAKKYSRLSPVINLTTENYKEGIKIVVKDNGIGISSDHQKQIFKKLYRVPTGNIHDVKGFGLGLYYTKTMAEAHGGFVKVYSELGNGSQFELYLPFKTKTINENKES